MSVKKSPRLVETRVIFLRIGEIDTVNERFFAEILVESRWEEPKLKQEFDTSKHFTEEKEIKNSNKYWNPKIYIENALNDPKQTIHYKIAKEYQKNKVFTNSEETEPGLKFWIYEYRKLKGYFFEKLNLEYFPLDVQDLSIVVTTFKSNKEVILIQNKEKLSLVGSNMTIDKHIWHLYQHVDVKSNYDFIVCQTNSSDSDEDLEKKSTKKSCQNILQFPMIMFQCRVSRRFGYYFWNAFFLIFLITAPVFAIFSIRSDQPHFRLPTTATLLLTSITFRWSYSTRCLPTVNYLTSLDSYSIRSIVLIFFCLVWHGFCTIFFNFYKYEIVNKIDKIILGILSLLFIVSHLILLLWIRSAHKIRKLMKLKDKTFKTYHSKSSKRIINDLLQLYTYEQLEEMSARNSIFSTVYNIDMINAIQRDNPIMRRLSHFTGALSHVSEVNETN